MATSGVHKSGLISITIMCTHCQLLVVPVEQLVPNVGEFKWNLDYPQSQDNEVPVEIELIMQE